MTKIRITPSQAAMLSKLPNGKSAVSGKDYQKKRKTENAPPQQQQPQPQQPQPQKPQQQQPPQNGGSV